MATVLTRLTRLIAEQNATAGAVPTVASESLSSLTLAELKALDAGGKMDAKFAGTRIPTFEEALAVFPKNVWLNCHLKGGAAVVGSAGGALHAGGVDGAARDAVHDGAGDDVAEAEAARQAADDAAFLAGCRVAVLLGQRLIGRKPWVQDTAQRREQPAKQPVEHHE